MTNTSAQRQTVGADRNGPVNGAFRYPLLTITAALVPVSVFFLLVPQVDLWVSGLFYTDGQGFTAEQNGLLQKIRHLGPHLVTWIAAGSVAILVVKLVLPDRPPVLPLRIPVFLISTLILGPGILVNAILKDNWGRPRPRAVEEFGGELPHQLVWVPTDYCASNCSFVSGEASAGIWLVALAFVVPAAWRRAVLVFVLPLCLVLSVNRIAFGGHFLSDTLISWGLTLMVIILVHRLFYTARFHPTDEGIDRWLTRSGRAVQSTIRGLVSRSHATIRRFLAMF
ncbi:MAG: phosphatase PAP2 family protein [Roseibium sp.]|nr:phosphatase PAP2 family protein [Roseibium sp.]